MGERHALEILYEGWETYQRKLAGAIAELTDEQLGLRAAPDLRTLGEQLQHMVRVRASWIHRDLGEGAPEYDDIVHWTDDDAPQRSADELRQGLEATWILIHECLERWSPEDLIEEVLLRRPGREDRLRPRGWVVWHLMEHDLHHGGELGFLLGMHGLPAPDI